MPGLNPLAPVFTPRAANVRPPVVDRIANDPAFNVEDVLGGIDVCSSDFEQVSKTQKVLTLACHPGLLPDGAEETPEMRAQVIGDALAVLEAVDYMPNSKTPKGEATTLVFASRLQRSRPGRENSRTVGEQFSCSNFTLSSTITADINFGAISTLRSCQHERIVSNSTCLGDRTR
eukprot:m.388819 g.388819  ORF g.388819 m.388819 type:complete len:175 (-) comp16753_c0_seq17:1664-2188(-)